MMGIDRDEGIVEEDKLEIYNDKDTNIITGAGIVEENNMEVINID